MQSSSSDGLPSLPPTRVYPHHQKVGPCFTRPAYRDGRVKKAVKVYTIVTESTYLLVFGIPSIDLEHALRDKCKHFGTVERLIKLSEYPEKERFTDVFLVKFDSVSSARRAKRSLDDSSFYGGHLHACFAPEHETVAECRVKLHLCRRNNARIARKAEHDHTQRLAGSSQPQNLSHTGHSSASRTLDDVTPHSSTDLRQSVVSTSSSDVGSTIQQMTSNTAAPPSGDPLDDARRYWTERRADFMTRLPASCTSVSSTSSSSSRHLHFFDQQTIKTSSPGSCPAKLPVPVPVLQALSWQPYRDPLLKDAPSTDAPELSVREQRLKSDEIQSSLLNLSSFVPRCLRTKTCNYTKRIPGEWKTKLNGQSLPDVPKTTTAISVGELKRLALTLGPELGPTLPPSGSFDRSVSGSKRIVFHRSEAKRPRLDANLTPLSVSASPGSTVISENCPESCDGEKSECHTQLKWFVCSSFTHDIFAIPFQFI
ncbi:hypothetical protein PHET_01040 [Paragonimus heterotremus]|uniref:RNA-binding protein 48 n=1 Tax=Paragonimus heterotremus TaxID=100268 RepID=A0A8J4WUV6_9TREM|nr:hypothetical protein PHET_01040 [Paragonimus heterotremus]